MKLKFAAVVAALALSGTAMAANTSITVTVPDILDTLDTGFTIQARSVAAGDSFTDFYKFVLGSSSDVYGGVASAKATLRNVVTKDIAFDAITLTGTTFAGTRASEGTLPEFLFSNLAEGSYTLKVTGHATGTLGGSYHGELLAAAAVPEPEVLAMALAGVGVVGALARRRKATAAA